MTAVPIRMMRESCGECPWLGELPLRAGRLRQLRDDVAAKDGVFLCHRVAGDGKVVGGTSAVCYGWRRAQLRQGVDYAPWEVQVAERLGMVEAVDA